MSFQTLPEMLVSDVVLVVVDPTGGELQVCRQPGTYMPASLSAVFAPAVTVMVPLCAGEPEPALTSESLAAVDPVTSIVLKTSLPEDGLVTLMKYVPAPRLPKLKLPLTSVFVVRIAVDPPVMKRLTVTFCKK